MALEKSNYDFLMGADLNLNHPEVRGEFKHWGRWMLDTFSVDGYRFDAIKHIASDFFVVGEYWTYDLASLQWSLATTAAP